MSQANHFRSYSVCLSSKNVFWAFSMKSTHSARLESENSERRGENVFWFHRRALWHLIHQHETGLGKSVQNLSTLCILAWQTNFCFHPKQFLSKVPSFYHGRIDFDLVFPIQSTLEQGTFEIRVIQSNLTFFQHVILSKLLPVFTDHHQTHPSARISCHNATRECYNIKILQITKS